MDALSLSQDASMFNSASEPLLSRAQSWLSRPASQHLRGFYCYSCAIEVYAVVSLTLFLPIALEQYARDAGSLASDHSTPCEDATSVCVVQILGLWTNTASFSLYTYSISVALQATTVIAISGQANDVAKRSRLLYLFTLSGAVSCILFLFIPSVTSFWPISTFLTIIGNVSFGCAMVCLNSYVPSLARQEVNLRADHEAEDGEISFRMSKVTSSISSNGIAIGYAAGISLLLFMLVPVVLLKGSLFSLRLAIAASGIWWLAFSIPAFAWLPSYSQDPPSASLPISQPYKELWSILKEWRKIPETFKYLLAWFVMSDAFSTITSTAVLFARTTLGMTASSLIFVGVLTPAFGIIGALAWPWLQQTILETSNLATLRIIVALAALIPVYGLFALNAPTHSNGALPVVLLLRQGLPSLQVSTQAQYYSPGALYGALQSYSRACFSTLIPPNEEARFFALYSITDKSSSFIGPALVAVLADLTGSVRAGFVFLVVALVVPIPLLAGVDMDQGGDDAAAYNESSDPASLQ